MATVSNDPNIYYKPKQNIPESQKGPEWVKQNADWIISVIPSRFRNQDDSESYNLFNGVRDDEQWDHITKTYGVEFPAGKIKHIPLVRPLVNELYGEAKERQLNWTVLSADNDSLSSKMEEISNKLLVEIVQGLREEEPIAVKMDSIQKYFKQDFKSELEVAANHVMEDFILNNKLKNVLDESLLDKFITGKEYNKITINRIGEDPIYEDIKPGQLFYANNNKKWVKDCDWAVHPTRMSPVEILDLLGDRMTQEDRQKVESWREMYLKDVYKLDSPWDADRLIENADQFDSYNWNNNGQNEKISVYHGQFKSIRKITYLENENKYVPDAPFIKIIAEEQLHELPAGRRKKIKERFIQDLYEFIRVGDDIHIPLGKVKHPIRSSRQPSRVNLSFNGLTFNGVIKPYSLMKVTDDIQNLYDIMHYHKENLIALSGVKGSFMDLSSMPDFGTGKFEDNLKMWFYYKKMGAAFIDRNKKGVDKSFNQYQQYDDTLGPGLDAILGTIQHLEELAGRIVGVNRQRLGSITQRDGKGVTDQAIFQSSLTTEPIFAEHDEFVQESLRDILQACRIAYSEGYTSSYLSNSYEQKIFSVESDFALADFNLYVEDASKDKRSIEEMKAFAFQRAGAGLLELDDISPLFRKGSFRDVEQTLSTNIAKRRAEMQQQQQQQEQLQAQLETAKTQAELEKTKAEIEKLRTEAQENIRKLQLEEESLNIDREYNEGRLSLDSKRVDLEAKQLESTGREREVRNK
jgi:hypothetical protein